MTKLYRMFIARQKVKLRKMVSLLEAGKENNCLDCRKIKDDDLFLDVRVIMPVPLSNTLCQETIYLQSLNPTLTYVSQE
jgi:hypothetical protein